MGTITAVLASAVAFVGSHFLLSHPLRKSLVASLGEKGFLGLYSLVAFVTLGWVILAYRAAPPTQFLWPVGDLLWAVVSVLMLIASILFMGSVIGNPALVTAKQSETAPEARGAFAITRHPMMWSFALWGACHIAVFPVAANIIVASAIIVLALAGAALQDRKKERLQPDFWPAWEAKTSYLPFAAVAAGKARLSGFRMHDIAGGILVWIAATWAHIPLSGWAAGIWRWL